MTTKISLEAIKSVEVMGLFRRFHHKIEFSEDGNIVIVTAPNGYGKTVMLRILDSFFSGKIGFFRQLSFEEATIQLFSGKSITITKHSVDLFDDKDHRHETLSIKTKGFGGDSQIHTVSKKSVNSTVLRYIDRNFPVERLGPNRWLDHPTGEVVESSDLVVLYSDRLPPKMAAESSIPEWLQDAFNSVQTHLVETQRLLSIEELGDNRYGRYNDRKIRSSSVVEQDAKDLANQISEVLQQYADESQKLDQSFPKRIIEFHGDQVADEEEIRMRLGALAERREALMITGLIGQSVSDPIEPSERFGESVVRRVLSIYIDDTQQKLSFFDEIYEKIRLFKMILDAYFNFKNILIDKDEGIRAIDNDTGDVIPLSELSSGEQHELVLIYELIFKVSEGSLILIDEPELSLHVAWQKRFIEDLQKIQELKKLDVVIATHSPQIINDQWNLVQELSA